MFRAGALAHALAELKPVALERIPSEAIRDSKSRGRWLFEVSFLSRTGDDILTLYVRIE